MCQTKTRWGWRELLYDVNGKVIEERLYVEKGVLISECEGIPDEQRTKEEEYREVFNLETNILDFGKLRPRDVKSNPRVCMPKPGSLEQDTEMSCREVLTDKVVGKYKASQARNSSLTKSEQGGMESLPRKIQSKEIIVYPTDKPEKLAVTMFQDYLIQGQEHVKGDKKVSWKEVQNVMESVKAHLWVLNKIFNTGRNHSKKSKEMTWKAKEAIANIIPKDHKQVKPDGQPKTRPVCGASETINQNGYQPR